MMSNLQPADARAALMTTVLLRHSLASADAVSLSEFLQRPSCNFNAQDLSSHLNKSGSPSKRQTHQDKSPIATRGRTIYNAQDKLAALSSTKIRMSRKLMKPTIHSCDALCVGHALLEENRGKNADQRFLIEAIGERYRVDDEDISRWTSHPDSHCLTPERNGGSQGNTPFLSPSSSTTSESDMEYSPHRWNVPAFNSGEGEWEAIFDMYIKEVECLEDGMRF